MTSRARRLWIWLTSIAAIVGLLWLAFGWGPVWERRLEGQVVDKRTGKGVPNAEVFETYIMRDLVSSWPHRTRWTTTDPEGRFVIPGALTIRVVPFGCTSDRPAIKVVHADYGAIGFMFDDPRRTDEFPGWRDLRLEIRPDESLDHLRKADWPASPTPFLCARMTNEGCKRVVELLCPQMKRVVCEKERKAFEDAEIDRQRARERGWR